MSIDQLRDEGVQRLMELVIHHARNGTIKDVMSMLVNGPPGRRPQQDKLNLHEWFQQLDHSDQKNLQEIITQAVDDALFSTFAILDRASGGLPIKDTLSDFALYLQSYESEVQEAADLPAARIKLNPWRATTDLHDLYRWQVDETNSID